MKRKIISLIIISIIYIFVSFIYYNDLSIFNNQYEKTITKLNEIKNYQYNIFINNKIINEIETIESNMVYMDDIDIEKISNQLSELEYKIKNDILDSIKKEYFKIIPRNLLKENKYKALNLSNKHNKIYKRMISNLFSYKDIILGNKKISEYTIDKLINLHQSIGLYQIEYTNILKDLKKENTNTKINKSKSSKPISSEKVKEKVTKENVSCKGIVFYNKKQATNKQKSLLELNKASSIYKGNNYWCVQVY